MKFIKLSHYAPEMVKDMRRRMSFLFIILGEASSKGGRDVMMIGEMGICSDS